MHGARYDIGSKFARGGIGAAAVTLVCFGLTTDGIEAERAELIAIIFKVAATMLHIHSTYKKHWEKMQWIFVFS